MNNRFSVLNRLAHKPIAFAFVLLFAGVGFSLIAFSRAATEATMKLSPAAADVAVDSTFTVDIIEDSGTSTVNGVQSELSFDPTKLQATAISSSGSPFTVEAESTITSGHVTIARGSFTPQTGSQKIATVTFKALVPGSASINVDDNSMLIQTPDNENILTTRSGAVFTLKDMTPPTAPGTASMLGSTATSISLGWAAATDNVGIKQYVIYRNNVRVGTTTSLTYNDTGLQPNNTYAYSIMAIDDVNNESPKSNSVSLTTPPDTSAPTAPGGITAGTKTPVSITLNWTAATDNVGVSGYRILRNGVQVGTSTGTSYTDNGLTPNTDYTYTVVAVDAAGNLSPASTGVALKTDADTIAPTTPGNVTATPTSSTSVTAKWTTSTDNVAVAGYRVYRNNVQVGTTDAATTTYIDKNLAIGIRYTYTITAVDAAGNQSANSVTVPVQLDIKPGDVNLDDAVNIKDLTILLNNWNKSSGVTYAMGDINKDGVINLFDLTVVLNNWNK